MFRTTLFAAIGAAALVSLGAAVARADTIVSSSPAYSCSAGTCTQSFNTGNQLVDWSSTKSTLEIFNLNLFDSSLGTLTGVTFNTTFGATITSGSLTNNAATSETFTFAQDTSLTMTTNGVNSALDTALAGMNGGNGIDPKYSTGSITLAASGQSGSTFTIPANTTETGTGTVTAPISAFIGSGTQAIDASTSTFDGFNGGGGNITTAINTTANAQVTVTYNYTVPPPPSVPEPFTAALLGSGVLILGLVRRRAF